MELREASGEGLPRFQYDELPFDDNHRLYYLRIFYLEPGAYTDGICGRLETFRSDAAPPYQALSYSWGSTVQDSTVILDRHSQLKVTANLVNGLRRLRDVAERRLLWADAICINQDDETERGHQVSYMRHIYQGATLVIVWLGEPTGVLAAETSSTITRTEIESLALLARSKGKHAWWRRLWVIQEFLYPTTRPMMQLGARRASIFQLNWAIENHKSQRNRRAFRLLEHLQDIIVTRVQRDISSFETGTLEERLYRARYQGCSDPKDRVYALLSLVDSSAQKEFTVDYTIGVPDLYAQATAYILRERRRVRLLTHLGLLFSTWKLMNDPTWALDLDKPCSLGDRRLAQIHLDSNEFWWQSEPDKPSLDISYDVRHDASVDVSAGLWSHPLDTERALLGERALRPNRGSIVVVGAYLGKICGMVSLPQQGLDSSGGKPQWQNAFQSFEHRRLDRTLLPNLHQLEGNCSLSSSIWETLYDMSLAQHGSASHFDNVEPKDSVRDWSELEMLAEELRKAPSALNIDDFLLAIDSSILERLKGRILTATDSGISGVSCSTRSELCAQNIAIGTREVQDGDALVAFYGSQIPCILRETPSGYLLIDGCVVPAMTKPGLLRRRDFERFASTDCRMFRLC